MVCLVYFIFFQEQSSIWFQQFPRQSKAILMFLLFPEMARVGEGKKVYQLEYVPEEQLMVALSGKQRHVRLIPVRALDGDDVEWIKVAETKGCLTFATGVMSRAPQSSYCLCVAIKRQVFH